MRILLVLPILLTGCIGDQRQAQAVRQSDPVVVQMPAAPAAADRTDEVKSEIQASKNAIQQSMSALVGVEVGKVAEKVEASLARVDARLSAQANVEASARAELAAQMIASFKAEMQAVIKAQVEADVRASAELRAELQALVGGQAGAFNRLDQMQQEIRAGRDAVTTTVEFSRDHVEVLKDAQETNRYTTWVAASLILALQELSRRRSEGRFKETFAILRLFVPQEKGKDHGKNG